MCEVSVRDELESDQRFDERYVKPESVVRLNAWLGFPEDRFSQDWEIENSNSDRIGEFLTLYEQQELKDDDRFALMALIVASFDECLLVDKANESLARRIRAYLVRDSKLHEATMHYWCVEGESDPEFMFRATPFIRETWNVLKSNEDQTGILSRRERPERTKG